MPNDEARRNDDTIRCVDGGRAGLRQPFRHSDFVAPSSLVIRHSSFVIRHSSFVIRHSSFVSPHPLRSLPPRVTIPMGHPIIQRELIGTLRTRRAAVLLAGAAAVFALLVISRWPGNATVELSGAQAQEVFRLFAYGLLTIVLLLVPAFPASSIVQEKKRGTLTLLLNSPMRPWSIFYGKAAGMLAFVALLLAVSIPAAAAAYAMGGISWSVARCSRCTGSCSWCCCSTRPWPCW